MGRASDRPLRARIVVAVGAVAIILIATGAVWHYRSTANAGSPTEPTDQQAAMSEIAASIGALKPFNDSPAGLKRGEYGSGTPIGDFVCGKRQVEGTDSQLTVLEPEANPPRWPGEILVLNPGAEQFEPLSGFDRTPIRISLEHNPSDYRSSSEPIGNPNWDSYSKELKTLLNDPDAPFHSTPSRIRESLDDLYSVEQLAGGAGMSYHFGLGLASIEADYSQSKANERHRYAFVFKQIYYTVRALTPDRPEELFTSNALPAVRERLTPSTQALYVSEIDYGRVVMLTVESSSSREEARGVLDVALRVAGHRGGIELTAGQQAAFRQVKIERTIRGGSGGQAAEAFGDFDKLVAFIREGGEFTSSSPGLPIGYRVTNLGGSQPVAFQVAYQEQRCSRVSQQTRVTLDRIEIRNSSAEICGRIWLEGSDFILWSTDCATAEREISTTGPILGTDGNSDVLAVPADASLRLHVDLTVDGVFSDDRATRVEVVPRLDWKEGYGFDVPVGDAVFNLVIDIIPE